MANDLRARLRQISDAIEGAHSVLHSAQRGKTVVSEGAYATSLVDHTPAEFRREIERARMELDRAQSLLKALAANLEPEGTEDECAS